MSLPPPSQPVLSEYNRERGFKRPRSAPGTPLLSTIARVAVALSGVALVAWIDLVTGTEIAVSIFYLVPVAWLTWHAGRFAGLSVALIASVGWYLADRYGGQRYSNELIPVWNATVRLGFFATTVEALHRLRRALSAAETAARKDPLTGLGNSRAFHETAAVELARSRRYGGPLSVVYLDIDNFKQVNDLLGHQVGDQVLQTVGRILLQNLRQVDYPARLGGDEFAILLPQADAQAAHATVKKLHSELSGQAALEQWPITFSVGIAAFITPADNVGLLLRRADELMYAVKRGGKNGIKVETYGQPDTAADATAVQSA